jgi:hypothetical protein
MVDKVELGQVVSPVLRFSPVNFIPPVLHYLEKWTKLIIFILAVAQEALRLLYVRSICCGALHHKKKNIPTENKAFWELSTVSIFSIILCSEKSKT